MAGICDIHLVRTYVLPNLVYTVDSDNLTVYLDKVVNQQFAACSGSPMMMSTVTNLTVCLDKVVNQQFAACSGSPMMMNHLTST